jgi:steroid 5-alpha reductase family enzyme
MVQVVVTLMVVAWSVRLGSFLFIRVLNTGKDSRFDEIKDDPGVAASQIICMHTEKMASASRLQKNRHSGKRLLVLCAVKFFVVWTGQAVWVWVTLLPVLILNATERNPGIRWSDIVGGVIWGLGFASELTADLQKQQWRKDPANKGRFIDVGAPTLPRLPAHRHGIGCCALCCSFGLGTMLHDHVAHRTLRH